MVFMAGPQAPTSIGWCPVSSESRQVLLLEVLLCQWRLPVCIRGLLPLPKSGATPRAGGGQITREVVPDSHDLHGLLYFRYSVIGCCCQL